MHYSYFPFAWANVKSKHEWVEIVLVGLRSFLDGNDNGESASHQRRGGTGARRNNERRLGEMPFIQFPLPRSHRFRPPRRAVDLRFQLHGKILQVVYNGLFYPRVFTASPGNWLVAYGHMYSLLMDMNSLYVVRTRTEETIAKFSLPPFRRSVRGSNFTPGEVTWLDGLLTSSPERLLFATSMPDYSVLLLMLKEST